MLAHLLSKLAERLTLKLVPCAILFCDLSFDRFELGLFFFGRKRYLIPMFDCTVVTISKGFGSFEDRCQGVVVSLLDRIELVIVTTSASERHSHKGFADGIELLINGVHGQFVAIGFREHLRAQDQKTSGCFCLSVGIGKQVTRDLLLDEPIEWLVRIKRLNDIVTVSPGVSVSDVLV